MLNVSCSQAIPCERSYDAHTSSEEPRSTVGSAARQGVDKLYDDVQSLQSDLKRLSSKVGRMAEQGLSRAQERVPESFHEAEEAVRRNPYSAVAIAVGIGFVLGIVLRR
jgi:ElaB/YqjD/DUF883 family membrane-anchored ribosome-binding protein